MDLKIQKQFKDKEVEAKCKDLIEQVLSTFKGSKIIDPNEPPPVREFKNNVVSMKDYAKNEKEDDFGF